MRAVRDKKNQCGGLMLAKDRPMACMVDETHKLRFTRFLEAYHDQRLLITTHKTADGDGICAAFVLSKLLPNAVIIFQDEPYIEARDIVTRFGIELRFLRDASANFDGVVIVDTSSSWRVPDAKRMMHENGIQLVLVIDHHEKNGRDILGQFDIVESFASSTCEVLYSLLPPDLVKGEVAFALAIGVLSDAGRYGKLKAIQNLVDYLVARSGKTRDNVDVYINPRLKGNVEQALNEALANAREVLLKGFKIKLTSTTMPIQPRVADELLKGGDRDGGCDIALATYAVRDNECDSSLRFSERVRVDAGIIMQELGKRFGGNGGGHPKKAGATTYATPEQTLEAALEIIKRKVPNDRKFE